jgi:inositol phosphorylceramide mannosyltransferase catalytic subunit
VNLAQRVPSTQVGWTTPTGCVDVSGGSGRELISTAAPPFGSFMLGGPLLSYAGASKRPSVATLPMGGEISKVIYQTFPTKNLPPELAGNAEYIRKLNPTYQYVMFDDADIEVFIESEYGPEMLAYYHRINPSYGAARADLFRYLLIYSRGGVYLDIKSRMLRPLDEIIREGDKFLLAKWGDYDLVLHPELADVPRGEFQNWHVIGVRGHPFLKAVIEAVLNNIDTYRPWRHGVGKNAVIRVTGPIAYTLAIHPLLSDHPNRAVNSQSDLSLEYATAIAGTHMRLFPSHYSKLEETVITLTGPAAYLSRVYFALKIHLLLRRIKHFLGK